jgi:intracellular sulfur oxidation DsrE/DsrF family protein
LEKSFAKTFCMHDNHFNNKTERRGFLGTLINAGTTIGLSTLAFPFKLFAQEKESLQKPGPVKHPADVWFEKVKGKHRMVFDATRPHEIMPFSWARIFLMTNAETGSGKKDCGVVIVLRHHAIPFAFEDRLWEKYKLGEFFKANDPLTKKGSTRNPFWKPAAGDFNIPGIGNAHLGINELQASGVLFCVCEAAITVNSALAATAFKMDPSKVKADWLSGLLPGIQLMPSGVWALARAQEFGCSYVFAG